MIDKESLQTYAELSQLELVRDGIQSYSAIRADTLEVLQRLQLEAAPLLEIYEKLKLYRYCTDATKLNEGIYTRWIDLETLSRNTPQLARGGIFLRTNNLSQENEGIMLKNCRGGIYTLPSYKLLMFQLLTDEELLVSKALDYVRTQ